MFINFLIYGKVKFGMSPWLKICMNAIENQYLVEELQENYVNLNKSDLLINTLKAVIHTHDNVILIRINCTKINHDRRLCANYRMLLFA